MFFLMNNVALALRGPLLILLTSGLGIHYAVSNVISLLFLTVIRYGLADGWIWAKAGPQDVRTSGPYAYDIHGIVSVSSQVRLPELERFRVGGLMALGHRVRLGRVSANGNGRVGSPFATARAGRPRIWAHDPCGRPSGPRRRRSWGARRTSSTNVVSRSCAGPSRAGYALVHAACLADRGRAFLLTARTETGKTTTSLKILDSTPYSFLSDDLTLLTPEGRVLTYPKPLTISRHTLRAVKTPLLSRRERLGLIFQSRLHSRSGRKFAFVLAKTPSQRRRSARSSSCSCRRRSSTWSGVARRGRCDQAGSRA
jgi:hypothetical protein